MLKFSLKKLKITLKIGFKLNSCKPFVKRGGNVNNGANAGVFYSNITNGNSNNNNGFRPALVVGTSIHREVKNTSHPDGHGSRTLPSINLLSNKF